MKTSTDTPHRWQFERAGGMDQVVFRSGADILHLDDLDQTLWAALACPTRGLALDDRTLDLLDTDGDGRIRPPEVLAATRWIRERLKDADRLLLGTDRLPLNALRDDTAAGRALREEARRTLELAGRPSATEVGLDDVLERLRNLHRQRANGDGVVPTSVADDEDLAQLIRDIQRTHGSTTDRSGEPGVDLSRVEAFFRDAEAWVAWRAQRPGPQAQVLGPHTEDAAATLARIRPKIEDYFTRCRLAAYDPAATGAMNPTPEQYRALAAAQLTREAAALAELPLAVAAPDRALPLVREAVNPAWADALDALRTQAVEPLLGGSRERLTEAEWHELDRRLAPWRRWIEGKPGAPLDALGAARIDNVLRRPELRERLVQLIEDDRAAAPQHDRLVDLEKTLRLQRDLLRLLHNFVSFRDFYSRRGAIFEAGTLYLDARRCDLAVDVPDPARHATLAGLAKAYLAYCECRRGAHKRTIAVAFTAGDGDFLLVGRNGVFYDNDGLDWDATITKVIENPLSVRQAFLAPYKKFLRMVEEQVAKRAAAGEKRVQERLSAAATGVATLDQGAKPGTPPAAVKRRVDVGTVAALGVALGSISTVLVALVTRFIELGWWIPVGVLGLILAISGPSMLIAWLKLRQRSLAPILDASGWAINGRLRLNVPMGRLVSRTARLPRGARRRAPALDAPPIAWARAWAVGALALAGLGVAAAAMWLP